MALGFDEVARTLPGHLDSFYLGDVELLRAVFHPAEHHYSGADGPLQDDPMEVAKACTYLPIEVETEEPAAG